MNEEKRWMIQSCDFQFYNAYTPNIFSVLNIDLISSFDILNLTFIFPLFIRFHSVVVALKLFFLAIKLFACYHGSHSVINFKVGTNLRFPNVFTTNRTDLLM